MNKKVLITLFVIFMALFSIGAVCANDADENTTAGNNIDSTLTDDGEDFLTEQSKGSSFSALNSTINSGSNEIDLQIDYEFDDESDGNLTGGIVIEGDNLVINGNNHTIDAKNKSRLFKISGKNIVISNLVLKNGFNSIKIHSSENIVTNSVTFINCYCNSSGGALHISNSTYTSNNDEFIDNYALYGSAIYADNSTVTINNGLLKNKNNAVWSLIYAEDSCVYVTNTTFANTTSRYAAAIYSESSEIYLKKSRFLNLFANFTAGALGFRETPKVKIEECEFINISSTKNGGAVFIDINGKDLQNGNVHITNTIFENCSSSFGGAYLQLGGNLTMADSHFTNNFADYNGGAVYLSDIDKISITNCQFGNNDVKTYDNYPTYGGAVFIDCSALTMNGCGFNNNTAYLGGALYLYESEYSISNTEFNGNGRAIYTVLDDEGSTKNLNGTDTISKKDFDNEFYPNVIKGEGINLTTANNSSDVEGLPSCYDLRNQTPILVSPVKDQGKTGSCWAFGFTAALESVLLKNGIEYDLSENNMKNLMLEYSPFGSFETYDGATNSESMGYLLSWLGAYFESNDTFDELGKISPLLTNGKGVHIQDIVIIPHTPGKVSSINNVKQAILKYGALAGCILMPYDDDIYYNNTTYAAYNPNHKYSNHEICVVGWDDNYPKDNFRTPPPANGAWIVKNSWGSDWGDGGYFYVSYYDQTMCAFPDELIESFVAIMIDNTIPYNKNYQYDFSGMTSFYDEGVRVTYANEYTACEDDVIAAIGTYFNKKGVNYEIEIEVNHNIVYTQKGISPFYGYHTIKLDKYVSIKKGDEFCIYITSNAAPLCEYSRIYFEEWASALFVDDEWEDLTEDYKVACIKVYTLPNPIKNDNIIEYYSDKKPFVVNVNESGAEVSISIDGKINMKTISDENGTAAFNISTQLAPGAHVVTTRYNNISIINTIIVLNTIKVPTRITLGYKPNYKLTPIFYDKHGKILANTPIIMTYDGKVRHYTTDSTGKISIYITGKIGMHTLKYRNPSTGQIITTKIKIITRLWGNRNIVMNYASGSIFKVRVYGTLAKPAANKAVIIKIDKKAYKVKTNSLGWALFRIPNTVKPGTHTITVAFAGQTVKNKLVVKHALYSPKKVTVKKSSKRLVLKVSLKSGKFISGKIIKFKFNGKTYLAKTNSRGVAQIILNKNVINKLKRGKTYLVQISYLKDTIRSSVKVK